MVRWLRWHCPPDTGLEIRALAVWGRARYLSVTEAPHNTDFHTWMGIINMEQNMGLLVTIAWSQVRQIWGANEVPILNICVWTSVTMLLHVWFLKIICKYFTVHTAALKHYNRNDILICLSWLRVYWTYRCVKWTSGPLDICEKMACKLD